MLLLNFGNVVRNGSEEIIFVEGNEVFENVLDNLSIGKGLQVSSKILTEGLLTESFKLDEDVKFLFVLHRIFRIGKFLKMKMYIGCFCLNKVLEIVGNAKSII
jgi:hypothetical protein